MIVKILLFTNKKKKILIVDNFFYLYCCPCLLWILKKLLTKRTNNRTQDAEYYLCLTLNYLPSIMFQHVILFSGFVPKWQSFCGVMRHRRFVQAKAHFEKLLGGSHVKAAMSELSNSDRGMTWKPWSYPRSFMAATSEVCMLVQWCWWSQVFCKLIFIFFGMLCYSLFPFAVGLLDSFIICI